MSDREPGLDLRRLDAEAWHRLHAALDQALDAPRPERAALLDRLCGGDATLRAQVDALLRADAAAEAQGTGGWAPGPAPFSEEAEDEAAAERRVSELLGRALGPWRLVEAIGRGGMGAVYRAERVGGDFAQQVAVKVLRPGLAAGDLLARFRRERQILARLEHPHIARFVDGGMTEDGLWWFALEYVSGAPITDACERRALDLDATLALFLQACDAVQFAHRNLVVHRDLKPSNILVSDEGEVKLLDFGIAKLLEPGATADERTLLGAAAMTPQYAAPEQVRGEAPTTATDVYAVGLVLYELLTGERAYGRKIKTLEEARRAVLEEEPEAPSARVRRAGPGTRRAAWARRLRGDLDAITLTALRKEPERRFASVEAMTEDLRRHREGRPVRATGRPFGYVAGKFLRRNRIAVLAASLVVLALAGGLLATARERDRARLEARKATEIKDFVLGLFRVSDPGVSRARDVSARELLEQGATRVERDLASQPAVQAEMWDLLGSIYYDLGLFPRSQSMYEKAVAIRRRRATGADTLEAGSLSGLGQALLDQGKYADAERAFREALAIQQRHHGGTSQAVALVLGNLAVLESRAGADAPAESLYRAAIAIDSLTVGMNDPATATDLGNLSMFYAYRSRYADALPVASRALAIRERVLGRDAPEVAVSLDQVASALSGVGRVDSAITLRRRALSIRRAALPAGHPDLAHSLMNLAGSLTVAGRYAEADTLYRQALAIRLRVLDPKDPLLAQNHNDLGTALFFEGELDSAEVHDREALRIWDNVLPPDHRNVLTCRNNLAIILRSGGRYAESEAIFRDVLARRLARLGPDDPDVGHTEYHLGILLTLAGRARLAEPYLVDAVRIREAAFGAADPRATQARGALDKCRAALGAPPKR
ncbi:MAG TPA: tetratricopeptide repeat protein [Candidatus Eisenbacteria bacterium]